MHQQPLVRSWNSLKLSAIDGGEDITASSTEDEAILASVKPPPLQKFRALEREAEGEGHNVFLWETLEAPEGRCL